MVQLPENYLNSAYCDNSKGVIIIHFKNSADEYFTYRYYLDKAYSFEQHIQRLELLNFSDKLAYKVADDLTVSFVEPSNQDWHPAACPGDNMISFAQYMAHAKMANTEDRKAREQADAAQ